MDSKTIETGDESSVCVTQRGKRGKPSRKLDFSPVYASPLEMQFRWESIATILKYKYGPTFSQWQLKVLLVVDRLSNEYGLVSVSYKQIEDSGCIRGMTFQEIIRSLDRIFALGMIEEFGRTTHGKHPKYRLTSIGDSIIGYVSEEYSKPSEMLTFKSKAFKQSA